MDVLIAILYILLAIALLVIGISIGIPIGRAKQRDETPDFPDGMVMDLVTVDKIARIICDSLLMHFGFSMLDENIIQMIYRLLKGENFYHSGHVSPTRSDRFSHIGWRWDSGNLLVFVSDIDGQRPDVAFEIGTKIAKIMAE